VANFGLILHDQDRSTSYIQHRSATLSGDCMRKTCQDATELVLKRNNIAAILAVEGPAFTRY